ncbi:MAG: hypothetical protein HQL14_06845 [Candidatus Omnitrophica bacterium]|nr:hypothetical protein [Candidatus Omnitrophota bacterium]
MEDLNVLIKKQGKPASVNHREWQFFVIGIGALRRMVAGSVNEPLLKDALAGAAKVKELLAEGSVVKLGQRIYIENRYNQAKRFKQDLFDQLDYGHACQFSDVRIFLAEADQLRKLLDTVHEDAPIVLGYLKNICLTANDLAPLRQALPFKGALTSVLKVMGSPAPEGFNMIVKETIKQGTFDPLLSLIIWISREWYRLAPQEVYAVFEVMAQKGGFSKWSIEQWDEFKDGIEGYYRAGLGMMKYELFQSFLKHQHDPSSIERLKIDIERQVNGDIAWGDFWGTDGPIADDLAILSRYIPVKDITLWDFSHMAQRLKHTLEQRRENWSQEVDEGMRELYRASFSKTAIVYEGAEDKAAHRDRLNQRLSLMAREDSGRSEIQEVFNRILRNQELRVMDQVVLLEMIFQSTGAQRFDLIAIPREDGSNLEWLGRWAVLLGGGWQKVVRSREVFINAGKAVEMISNEDLDRVCADHRVPTVGQIKRDFNDKDKQRDWMFRYPGRSPESICRNLLSIRLLQVLKKQFMPILDDIKIEQANYKLQKQIDALNLYIGFFDDFFHLMGCMGTGGCIWHDRDRQVADIRYHFGIIALKDEKGRFLGKALIQLIRSGIMGLPEKRSPKGWQVLVVTTNNLFRKNLGADTFEAYTAMFKVAQILAHKNGLQGAVLIEDPEMHAQEALERGYVEELVRRGWLIKKELSENIIGALNRDGSIRYQYTKVYLIQIPSGAFHLQSLRNERPSGA